MSKHIKIHLPKPHEAQAIFVYWMYAYPKAHALIAPCGTKFGKSFACALWLATEAVNNPRSFCVWIAPTYLKCKIGYRYMKYLLDIPGFAECVDGALEIRLANGSFIKFLHGRDSEVVVEGEAVDRFVIDESGKQSKQLWFSLFTTITQTQGYGIVTGTPRGFNWYYEEFRKAKTGDPFYCWDQLRTEDSPFVKPEAIEQARRLLPPALFQQYYQAMFVSDSTVFGDLSTMWDESLDISNPQCKFWIHPDAAVRGLDTVTGWDIAKHRDYSVFFTVNAAGNMVGYARMRRVNYQTQVGRLKHYMETFFKGDRSLRYDKTGVGDAVGEMITEADIDASITGVNFTNQSKQEMISRSTMAIERKWLKAPRIEQIDHEFSSYEVKVTKSGLYSYSAPDGDHDDTVSAGMLAISGAYQSSLADDSDKVLEQMVSGDFENDKEDDVGEYLAAFDGEEDGFFDDDKPDDFSFDLD